MGAAGTPFPPPSTGPEREQEFGYFIGWFMLLYVCLCRFIHGTNGMCIVMNEWSWTKRLSATGRN